MDGIKSDDNFRVWNAKFEKAVGKESLPSVQMARNYFLKAVAERAPEVLQDLSREPFRRFRATNLFYEADANRAEETRIHNLILEEIAENSSEKLFDEHYRLTARRLAWTRYERPTWKHIEKPYKSPFATFYLKPTRRDTRIKRFAQSLFAWSFKHNLNAFWCREIAFETLNHWCSLPKDAAKTNWYFNAPIPAPVNNTLEEISLVSYSGDSPESFRTTHKVAENLWSAKDANGLNKFKSYETAYPAFGINADEEKEILEFYAENEPPVNRNEVREFLNQCEAAAYENQFTETPRLHTLQHFDWLALYQCAGWSGRKIAERINQKPPTVSGEVKKLAAFCEIKLRKQGRGRPKKKN